MGQGKRIGACLEAAGHGEDQRGPLFRPVRNNTTKITDKHIDRRTTWNTVRRYAKEVGIQMEGLCPHSLRAAAKVYNKCHLKPEQSPTFNTNY